METGKLACHKGLAGEVPWVPTWLLFPFWVHSIFFSTGASQEI